MSLYSVVKDAVGVLDKIKCISEFTLGDMKFKIGFTCHYQSEEVIQRDSLGPHCIVPANDRAIKFFSTLSDDDSTILLDYINSLSAPLKEVE